MQSHNSLLTRNRVGRHNIHSSLNARLRQYNLTYERYSELCKELSKKGYTQEQCTRIALKISPTPTIKILISNHSSLIRHFTHEQLTQIASYTGSKKPLLYIIQNYKKLIRILLNASIIVRIASKSSSLKRLQDAVQFRHIFMSASLSPEKILSCLNSKKRKDLPFIHEELKYFTAIGYSKREIKRKIRLLLNITSNNFFTAGLSVSVPDEQNSQESKTCLNPVTQLPQTNHQIKRKSHEIDENIENNNKKLKQTPGESQLLNTKNTASLATHSLFYESLANKPTCGVAWVFRRLSFKDCILEERSTQFMPSENRRSFFK